MVMPSFLCTFPSIINNSDNCPLPKLIVGALFDSSCNPCTTQNINLGKNATHQFVINSIHTIFCGDISLTYKSGLPMLHSKESKFLLNIKKYTEEIIWIRALG